MSRFTVLNLMELADPVGAPVPGIDDAFSRPD